MDGNSKPYFRHYRYGLPQDTQLPGRSLSHHYWNHGSHRLFQQVDAALEMVRASQSSELLKFAEVAGGEERPVLCPDRSNGGANA
jgi:hypothetical protein